MRTSLVLTASAFAVAAASVPGHAATIGAFWAFQAATNTAAGSASLGTNPSLNPNVETLAGSPTLTVTSSAPVQSFSSPLPGSFDDFQGTTWQAGTNLAWNTNSTGNSFTLNLDTTDAEDLQVRLGYRLTTGGTTAYSLDYRVGGAGSFTAVSGLPALSANSTWQTWSLDLSAVSAIEDQSQVELRWTLPNMGNTITFRVDNLQVTATEVPEPVATGLMSTASLLMLRRRRRA